MGVSRPVLKVHSRQVLKVHCRPISKVHQEGAKSKLGPSRPILKVQWEVAKLR